MNVNEKYINYLKGLKDNKIYDLWDEFCEFKGKDDQYRINLWHDKKILTYYFDSIEEILFASTFGNVNRDNWDSVFFKIDSDNNIIVFNSLTDENSPVDFKELAEWIIEEEVFEEFKLLTPEEVQNNKIIKNRKFNILDYPK